MIETVSAEDRLDCIESALLTAEVAYEDCAAWCVHIAETSGAGLPQLDETARAVIKAVLNTMSKTMREKAAAVRAASTPLKFTSVAND